jgi:class I fructose-bisphosphate aldolase
MLNHECKTISKEALHAPGPAFIDEVFAATGPAGARSPQSPVDPQPRAAGGTGYMSILRSTRASSTRPARPSPPTRSTSIPRNIVKLAIEGGCNAVASTLGVLGAVSRKYAHKIPFIVKVNHNELLSYPNTHDQRLFASVDQAFDLGAAAVGATVYYGSEESRRQIEEISAAFERAHDLGMVTVLWAYLRNEHFAKDGVNYETAADLTGQANHLAATIEADIVKQKQPTNNGGFRAVGFGKTHPDVYSKLCSEHPIDMTRYQVVNCYMGRVPLINSGGAAGKNDLRDAVLTAVINKRAGGAGLISGRKAFQRPMQEGVDLSMRSRTCTSIRRSRSPDRTPFTRWAWGPVERWRGSCRSLEPSGSGPPVRPRPVVHR